MDITLRISVFYDEDFIITVHRNEIKLLDELIKLDKTNKKLKSSKSLVNSLVSQSLKTFENLVINDLSEKLDDYEERVFLHSRRKPFLMRLYYLKRQIDLIRIILTLYKDIVDYFHMPEYQNIYTQDLRDIYSRTNTLFRNIGENTAQLLSVYFNIESNHTNEIMRTLTIISVFFMPLTFIVGVYGMNFKYMPELDWRIGYPAVWLLMLVVSILIYIWFKRKRWL
jgi:magnesium transporter